MLSPGAIFLEIALLAGPAAAVQSAAEDGPPRPVSIVDQDEIDLSSQSNIVLGVGARALGMGGAFLARPDDATAATWNPAGLSYLRRPEVSIVGDILTTRSTLRSRLDLDNSKIEITNLDFVAVTYPFSVKSASGSAQISYQRAIPFDGNRTTVTENELELEPLVRTYQGKGGFDVLAFGLGFRPSRSLRVGGTLNRWFNGYEQRFERTPRRRAERFDRFEMSAWNVNLGLIWSPIETLNLAVVGKTPFTADVFLYRERTDIVTGEDGEDLPSVPVSHESDNVRLEFPGAWGAGVSWRPRNNLTFSSDYTRTYWSKARIRNYFTLLQVDEGMPIRDFDSLVWPNVDAERQGDSIQLRFGVEYIIFAARVKVPVRAGYVNEQIYTLDYRGRAPHLSSFTAGTGLIAGSALLDVAYQYQQGDYLPAGHQLLPGEDPPVLRLGDLPLGRPPLTP